MCLLYVHNISMTRSSKLTLAIILAGSLVVNAFSEIDSGKSVRKTERNAEATLGTATTESNSQNLSLHAREWKDHILQAQVQADGEIHSDEKYIRRAEQPHSGSKPESSVTSSVLAQTSELQKQEPISVPNQSIASIFLNTTTAADPTTTAADPKICEVGGGGIILPLFGDSEQRWPKGLRIFLYTLGLLWLFEAVGIVADVFMAGIEKITSAKKRVYDPALQTHVTCTVWNGTIANLTLMALGSSAPEILLSMIELLGNDYYSGDLGPGTIVGSAAFNLLVISAVCVMAIPTGEVRYIRFTSVYAVTASFSIFAYIWLVTIVSWSSTNIVSRGEASMTLVFFFVLIVLAYLADKGYFSCFEQASPLDEIKDWRLDKEDASPEQVAFIAKKIREASPKELTEEEVNEIIRRDYISPTSLASFKHFPQPKKKAAYDQLEDAKQTKTEKEPAKDEKKKKDDEKKTEEEEAETKETAAAEESGIGTFDTLDFETHEIRVGGKDTDFILKAVVIRSGPADKTVTCKIKTEGDSAIEEQDFVAVDTELSFQPGKTEASVNITIKAAAMFEGEELFRVILSEPSEGAKINANSDGGTESSILTVVIEPEDVHGKGTANRVLAKVNWDQFRAAGTSWGDQFVGACFCGGSPEAEEESTWFEYLWHLWGLPWKLLFATVPPPLLFGGWACFCIALCEIGFVTAIIGDLAAMLGCCANIKDEVTAITLVALGTSLPDTFASKQAAQQEAHADNSIGNITGSNCVNVFLGLGLPWTVAAFYWQGKGQPQKWKDKYPDLVTSYPDGAFVVMSGSLEFSVIIFVCCALCAMGILLFRRISVGGELGGPTENGKKVTAFSLVGLWLFYIGISIWDSGRE